MCGRCAMPDGHCCNILLFWRRSTAALVFWVGTCLEVSLFFPAFPLVPISDRPTGLCGHWAKIPLLTTAGVTEKLTELPCCSCRVPVVCASLCHLPQSPQGDFLHEGPAPGSRGQELCPAGIAVPSVRCCQQGSWQRSEVRWQPQTEV